MIMNTAKLTPAAAAVGAAHAPDLSNSHLEALGPQEVIYDASATPAQGRQMLFDQLNGILDQVEKDETYAGLAIDVIYDKANNQLLCVRLVPVDVLSEGCEPSRRIAA